MSCTAGRNVRKGKKHPIDTAEKDSATEEVVIKKVGKNRGLIIYNRLCKNVQRRRQLKESIEMEKNMLKEYSRNNSRHGDSSSDESGTDELVFQDDAILGDTERLKNKTKEQTHK